MAKNNSFTWGDLNAQYTRRAMDHFYNGKSSREVTKIISTYKGAPKVSVRSIASLRSWMTRNGLLDPIGN